MDASLSNYLKSLMPNWNHKENPLYRAELNHPEERPFNYLANKILSDMSEVSFDKRNHQTEFMCQIFKLNTLIKAYDFIENAARNYNTAERRINKLKNKEFTEYKNSLRRLGLREGQFEDVVDEFQRLSMVNIPKENIYEKQIHKMVTLVKDYLDDNKLNIDARDNSGNTEFCRACMSGELEKAKILLALGCDPNIPALLYSACTEGMTELVDFLIREGNVDPNIKYRDCPPLYIACSLGFDKIVSIIAKSNRANLDATYKGLTPFIIAIDKGNEKCARILMEAGFDINAQDELGRTLFLLAAVNKKLERVRILLSLGCDPNIPNTLDVTPFYAACLTNATEIVDDLIKRENVDPNIRCQGCSPLYVACEYGFDEIVSIIVNSKRIDLDADYNGVTPFAAAIVNGNEKCARILIEAGVDINAQDASGTTLFHLMLKENNLEKAEMLLALGCDPNIPDTTGITPFYTACCEGMTEIVDILINRGDVDPNIQCQGYTPLFVACEFGFNDIVSIIVNSRKVELNSKCNGRTPISVAIDNGNKKCARILINAGVDINEKHQFGNTLFHLVVTEKNSRKAKRLLLLGCDPNIPNSRGCTPFYTACSEGTTEIVDMLVKSGKVDPNIMVQNYPPITSACDQGFDKIVSIIAKSNRADLNVTYEGRSPLAVAIHKRHEECARILVEEDADVTFDMNNSETPLLLACAYGFENVASLIAEKNQINISALRLDLHNIATVFNQAKIKLASNFLLHHNYNFANLSDFLNSLNEEDKHSLRRETLDSFCSSIVAALKRGSFQEFTSFLDYGKSFYKSTIDYIIDVLKLEVDKTIVNIMQRYEQILQVEIESEKGLKTLDKLKLAYLIEIEILKIKHVSHRVFSQNNEEYPRTIIVEKNSRRMFILAKKQFSIIRGKGGFKDVKSALLVPKKSSLRVERVVYAKIIRNTKEQALDARKEYELIKEFSGFTGFGKAYKFFCFDKSGNYVNTQQLDNERQDEEIQTSLVLEEMDSDFRKVVTQLTLNEQISVTKQFVEAINIMMRKESVSWDLKLHNVLFRRDVQSNDVRVAITDLGLAHDIRQDVVQETSTYGSPKYGAPELLYATDNVADANGYLKCEMWALGLIMYIMRFENECPLIDRKYNGYRHLPVVDQIAHYELNYNEYVQKHNDLIEKPLQDLLLVPKEARTTEQNLDILTYRMLQLDRNVRINPTDAEEFCREHF